MIKILIADDHTMFADGIASILALEDEIEVIGKSSTAAGVFRIVYEQAVNIILLDVNLPDLSGIEVAKRLTKEKPDIKILAISMFNEESFISEMLHNGAAGYILKNTDKEELLSAIHSIYKGQNYFSKAVTETIMQGLVKDTGRVQIEASLPKISRREQEILNLIAKEYTTREIAERLFISLKTVESHRSSLLAKFDVRNSVGLIRMAIEKGLIT